jgi:uncharacterized FAD-dependent dehydrogenase
MKIAVIGFGAGAIGFLGALKGSEHQIDVFEKAKDIHSSSVSGIRADGKIFVSADMGGDLQVDLDLQKKVVEYYLSKVSCSPDKIEKGSSFTNSKYFESFYAQGFNPIHAEFWHIGTDELKNVVTNIYEELNSYDNINFHFNSQVDKINLNPKAEIHLSNGDKQQFDKVVVGVGRTGHRLVKSIINQHPDLIMENTKVDLGVRFELPNHIVENLNREMYEFKVQLRTASGYSVRTFCNNPSGYVVTEKYEDFMTVNGHAKLNEKSSNTNFAILVTHSFTQPFNDPIGYGSYIAKLSNILAGGDKVILQTFGDFARSKRTKHLGRVKATLPQNEYILGDLNLVFPGKTCQALTEFITSLDKVLPGIAYSDNLMYGTECKFYSNKVANNLNSNILFMGDCSGWTRSITYATAHGAMLAQDIQSHKM